MDWTWIIIGGVVAVIVLWFIGAYNGFVALRNKVKEAFATMDVYLKKRHDLIPNLVETVKGYKDYEASTLEKVIKARNAATTATTVVEKQDAENALTGTLRQLFALSEAYPDLKANTNFLDLQQQLKVIEEDIAQSRKYYNAVVKTFNTKCEMFPSNIVAGIGGFKQFDFFEAGQEERENVQVKF